MNKEHREVVKIVNPKQALIYCKHGLKPIRIYYDDKGEKFVYVFNKAETQPLFTRWVNHEFE